MPDKNRERYYFDALRAALPEMPKGEAAEPEPPDFVLSSEGGVLGIELTVFHLPTAPGAQSYQERQSLKNQIVQRAERMHHEAGGPPLYVTVFFSAHSAIRKQADPEPIPIRMSYSEERSALSNLLRHSWLAMVKQRRLPEYVLANNAVAFFFAKGQVQDDKVWFIKADGSRSRQAGLAGPPCDAGEASEQRSGGRIIEPELFPSSACCSRVPANVFSPKPPC